MPESRTFVLFIQDFERICRGETTFNQAGLILRIQGFSLGGSQDGHVCGASVCISQSPCDCACSWRFVGSRALYFHLRP